MRGVALAVAPTGFLLPRLGDFLSTHFVVVWGILSPALLLLHLRQVRGFASAALLSTPELDWLDEERVPAGAGALLICFVAPAGSEG